MTDRAIIVALGGPGLRPLGDDGRLHDGPEARRIGAALRSFQPTHMVIGGHRGADKIWQELLYVYGLPAQMIRIESTLVLRAEKGDAAYVERRNLLWALVRLLWMPHSSTIMCFSLPYTDDAERRAATEPAERLGMSVTEFQWPWRAKRR